MLTRWSALTVAVGVRTFPKIVVRAITSSSGDFKAKNIAIASSAPHATTHQVNSEKIHRTPSRIKIHKHFKPSPLIIT
jgi:hypothetical protein